MDPLTESPIAIQPPGPGDAGIISRILERSIRTGGALDHRNNPCLVEAWLRHKGCKDVDRWLLDDALYLRLGWLHGKPAGVALALTSGEICLCYVQPECFRQGVGRALMLAMEGFLRRQGHRRAMLYSTGAASGFHQRLGYRQTGRPLRLSGLLLVPMDKVLADFTVGRGNGLVKRG
jgi:GNAT superfamily N-acetyltransferase